MLAQGLPQRWQRRLSLSSSSAAAVSTCRCPTSSKSCSNASQCNDIQVMIDFRCHMGYLSGGIGFEKLACSLTGIQRWVHSIARTAITRFSGRKKRFVKELKCRFVFRPGESRSCITQLWLQVGTAPKRTYEQGAMHHPWQRTSTQQVTTKPGTSFNQKISQTQTTKTKCKKSSSFRRGCKHLRDDVHMQLAHAGNCVDAHAKTRAVRVGLLGRLDAARANLLLAQERQSVERVQLSQGRAVASTRRDSTQPA